MEIVKSRNFVKTPVLRFQKKVGSTFVGVLRDKKAVKNGQIYEFTIEEGDVNVELPTLKRDAKGQTLYDECLVNPGDTVTLFGGTKLDSIIGATIEIGQRLAILYKGPKVNPKSGRTFNDYVCAKLAPGEAVDWLELQKA